MGRAARNLNGRVIMFAEKITDSMQKAIETTLRRRAIQEAYNKKHGITPKTIEKRIHDIAESMETEHDKAVASELALDLEVLSGMNEALLKAPTRKGKRGAKNPIEELIKMKEDQMKESVKVLDIETAAILRDEIKVLRLRMEAK